MLALWWILGPLFGLSEAWITLTGAFDFGATLGLDWLASGLEASAALTGLELLGSFVAL